MNTDYTDLGEVKLTPRSTGDNDASSSSSSSSSIRILQVTDLHVFPKACPSFRGIALRDSYERCLQLIEHLVSTVQPDVIVLTGDIIDGRGPWKGKQAVTEALRDMIPYFHETPWMYVPGNHDDDDSPWTRADLLQLLTLPGCIQRHAAVGFHHTVLLSKAGDSGADATTARVRLHMFDSGGNHPDPKIMYEYIPRQTVENFLQYTREEQSLKHDDDTPELVFLHIPTPEYQHLDPVVGANNLFEAALMGGKVPFPLDRFAWLIRLFKLDRIAGCRRGGEDSGLVEAVVHANRHHQRHILALLCGHDHHSDAVFWKEDDDIFLGYGRSGSMTPPFDWEGTAPNALRPGARVVEIDPHRTVSTWVVTADGIEEESFLDMTHFQAEQSCCLSK